MSSWDEDLLRQLQAYIEGRVTERKEEFIRQEPAAAPYFRPWYGSQEFINNTAAATRS